MKILESDNIKEITQEDLMRVLSYDPHTGIFTRKVTMGRMLPGTEVNGIERGYIRTQLFGKAYLAHRLAWLYVYGEFPSGVIDHINGNKLDNKINNLRDVCHAENSRNQRPNKNNTTGNMGVYWNKCNDKWIASARYNGKYIYFGCYKDKDDAIKARIAGIRRLNFHENHGVAYANIKK